MITFVNVWSDFGTLLSYARSCKNSQMIQELISSGDLGKISRI